MSTRLFSTFLTHLKSNTRTLARPWPKAWAWQKSFDRLAMEPDHQGFLLIGEYRVFAWSLSGIETTVVVNHQDDGFSCCFDMGYACRANVKCDHVFISHGHMDHIAAVPLHNRKRELMGRKPSKYYLLPHLIEPLQEIQKNFLVMNEHPEGRLPPDFVAVKPGDTIELQRGYYAISFPTVHRVLSQGYLLYKTRKKLKEEFKELAPQEIGALRQKGVDIHNITHTPEVAFTGDTTFELFTNGDANPDIFNVKLLIVEATYINNGETDEESVSTARKWGHIDIVEFAKNAHLFENVENILFIHFSDKYSADFVERTIEELPKSIKDKVFVATLAKKRYL